jgi:hypothetical protein
MVEEVIINCVYIFGVICVASIVSYVIDKILAIGKSLFNRKLNMGGD